MLTMADMANLGTLTPFQKVVIYSMLANSQLFDLLPFDDTGDLNVMVMEATGLPTPDHRPINPTTVNVARAQFGQRPEALKIISNRITVDRQQLNNRSSHVDPRTSAIEQYMKSLAYQIVNMFINGNPVINPDEPGGLSFRFLTDTRLSDGTPNPATQLQVIDANDINRDLTIAANRQDFLNDIHELISLIDGGNPDVLITNRQGWLRVGIATRGERMFSTSKDMFGRQVQRFGDDGPIIIDSGYPPSAVFTRATLVQPFVTAGGDDLVSNSIYAVKFGTSQVGALQKIPPEVIEFAENSADFPLVVAAYEWVYGFHVTNPFATALLRRAF